MDIVFESWQNNRCIEDRFDSSRVRVGVPSCSHPVLSISMCKYWMALDTSDYLQILWRSLRKISDVS
jgi:hypothetical protein